ncbi:S-layer homology domain-containing protein [Paenibacillus sp. OV219]|uniref:S-layer homology domain-containing protein n=1 Tax=Paenibacillus sp. OV219 TaxID=1884377 RepID=UPI0008B3E73D|nr:S-layer homology domain-containing protein [Paenibacillus sp. OV219]SEM53766.1 S-layer homology domain-containing protein [Paenibacillus sp. OV219]
MKKMFTSALIAAAVAVSAVPAAYADGATISFNDIENSYAKDAIQDLFSKAIVTGMDNKGHFSPKGTLTRAQFVTIMVKALGLKAESTTSSFTDVNGWALPYVEAAYQAGIINGVGKDKFDPNASVTREMSATILVKSLKVKGALDEQDAGLTFNDADKIAAWAAPFIGLAQKYKLVNGFPDGTFDPKGISNREMGAAMASNLLQAIDGVSKETETAPVISNVSIKSSNDNTSLAKVGDTITLTFTTNEQVSKLSSFKINGSNPASFTSEGSGNNWINTATYVLDETDPVGPVNFQINVKNEAGLYSITTEATNDSSSVAVLAAPVISVVNIVSNNEDPTKATVGDSVTLKFTTDQEVSKLSNFKINGGNPTTLTSIEEANHTWTNTATYVIDASDPVGPMNFQINVKNLVGLYSITTEATTDESAVTVY